MFGCGVPHCPNAKKLKGPSYMKDLNLTLLRPSYMKDLNLTLLRLCFESIDLTYKQNRDKLMGSCVLGSYKKH